VRRTRLTRGRDAQDADRPMTLLLLRVAPRLGHASILDATEAFESIGWRGRSALSLRIVEGRAMQINVRHVVLTNRQHHTLNDGSPYA
jgi:hypothetical protein